MSQGLKIGKMPWLEQWSEVRIVLVKLLRSNGYVPADQHGTRRDDAEAYPHISILRERKLSKWEALCDFFFKIPTAAWIGTVFFPSSDAGRAVLEVFGKRNVAEARRIAWLLLQESGIEIVVRLAHPRERTEEEDVPHVSDAENWGKMF